MLDIHVGVRRDELKPFKRILDKQFERRLKLSSMEDRWENWAEHWGDDLMEEDDIIHVVITTDIPMNTLQFLVAVMMVFLNDITDDDNSFVGKFIIVTDHGDWISFYHELSYPE